LIFISNLIENVLKYGIGLIVEYKLQKIYDN